MPDQKSLILVTVDCLRADHCGFMGYPVPTTPFLDRLAAQSFVFSQRVSGRSSDLLLVPSDSGVALSVSLGSRDARTGAARN